MSSVLSRIQIIMEANTANYNNELRRAQQNSDKAFGGIGKVAKKMALGVGAAIVGMGAKVIHTAGNFEEAMNAISAVSGAAGKDFDDLREKAKLLGSDTAYSATEAANGMEFLAKAGLNTEQILSTIPNALALASAGSIDLASSADILSNIMSGMGIAAEDSGRAADVLAKAAASSNVDVSMLGESMKYVAPIAKQLGVSLEETTAIIGVLGNAGIQASQSGTSLRAMFTRFNTHKAANAAFKELGVSLTDGNGKMRSMIDVMKDLSVATESLDPAKKLDYFKDMAGVEAMSALAVAVDAAADGSLQNLTETLKGAKGAAEEMAAVRMEGFKGSIKSLMSAFEGLQIAFADNSGLLELATGAITVFADKMRELSKALPEITAKITEFFQSAEVASAIEGTINGLKVAWEGLVSVVEVAGDIIAPVIAFFIEHEELSKSLAIAIGVVAAGFVVYNAAIVIAAAVTVAFTAVLALVTAPITLIVVGITALIAASVYLYRNWDELKVKAAAIWQSIKDSISVKVEAAKQAIVNTWNAAKTATVNTFNGIADSIVTTLKELPSRMLQIGKDIVNGLIDGIKEGASGVATAIGSMASSAVAKAKSVLDIRSPSRVMKKVGEQTAEGMANGIKKGKKAVVTEAQKMAAEAVKAVKDGIQSLEKELSLFGKNNRLAEFNYDVGIGKYKGAAQSDINKTRELLRALNIRNEEADVTKEMVSLQRSIYDASVLYSTELGRMNYELDDIHGKYKNINSEIKDSLRDEAAKLDAVKLRATAAKAMMDLDRQMALLGNDDLYSQLAYEMNEATGSLYALDDAMKEAWLSKAALLEQSKKEVVANESIGKSVSSINKELALMGDKTGIAELMYDLMNTDRYANASAESIESLVNAVTKLDNANRGQALTSVMDEIIQESPAAKIEADYQRRLEVLDDYESQWTALVGVHSAERAAIEQSYMDAKRNLMLTQGESLFSDLSGMAKAFAGEQSGIYRALFAVEKGFAIAQSAIAIQQSVAKAMALGFPQNIPVIAQTIGMGASLLGNIKSIAMPVGQAHDGIANVPREGTWVLDKNERVVKADDNKKLSRFLDGNDKKGAGVNITINNNSSASVSAKRNADGTVTIEMVDKMIEKSFRRIRNSNSIESKSIQRGTTARPNRS